MINKKVYYNFRPIRVVFFVTKTTKSSSLESIISFNNKSWGGRYNKIVLIESTIENIQIDDLNFIKQSDGDVFYSFKKLTKKEIAYIYEHFSPIDIIIHQNYGLKDNRISFNNNKIHSNPEVTMPSRTYLEKINPRKIELTNFVIGNKVSQLIKNIIQINFGSISDLALHPYKYHFDSYKENEIKHITINTNKEFISTLENLQPSIFINQFSHSPQQYNSSSEQYINDIYLVLGNSIQDYIFYQNIHSYYNSDFRLKFLNCFIAPIGDLTKNINIIRSLYNFINKYSYYIGGSNNLPRIVIVSSKFSKEEIEKIIPNSHIYLNPEDLKKSKANFYFNTHSFQEFEYVSLFQGNNEIIIPGMEFPYTSLGNGSLMIDLYIESKKVEGVFNGNGNESIHYFQSPPHNNLLTHTFRRLCRSNYQRIPSILVDKAERSKDNKLKIHIGTTNDYIQSYIQLPKIGELYNLNFSGLEISTEGKSVIRMFNLFNGKRPDIGDFINNPFWLKFITNISNQFDQLESETKIVQVLENQKYNNNIKAEKIFNQFKGYAIRSQKYFTLSEIKKYLKEYQKSDEELKKISEVYIQEELDKFIEIGVFSVGILYTCNHCGIKGAILLDHLNSETNCWACGKSNKIFSESKWVYIVNPIFYGGKGALACLHLLEYLHQQSRISFVSKAGVDIKEKNKQSTIESVTDIDVVCISDGYLYFCEVKFSRELLKKDSFIKLGKVIEKVKPDYVIFAAYGKMSDNKKIALRAFAKDIIEKYGVTIKFHNLQYISYA